jgi:hypothetical protein
MKLQKFYPVIITISLLVSIASCIHDPFLDPTTLNEGLPNSPGCLLDGSVCFESSVLPIFISSCARTGCHDAHTKEEGFVLDTYDNIVRKGIKPGNAKESKLYKVLFESGEDRMPPDGSMTTAQKELIAAWINEGAKNTVDCDCNCDPNEFNYAITIQPMMNTYCVGCHKPGSLGGNIDLSTFASIKTQVSNGNLMGSITHAAGYVAMPQGSKLSDCQIEQVKNWVNAGALNN